MSRKVNTVSRSRGRRRSGPVAIADLLEDFRGALLVRSSSEAIAHGRTLFECGGSKVLDRGVREVLAEKSVELADKVVEYAPPRTRSALEALAATEMPGLPGRVRDSGRRCLRRVSKRARGKAAVSAVKGGLRVIGRAGAVGAAFEGGAALVQASMKYSQGSATGEEVVLHAAREAGRGGLCAVVGTGAAMGVAAVVAAPEVALASVGLLAAWVAGVAYEQFVPTVFAEEEDMEDEDLEGRPSGLDLDSRNTE